MVFQPEKKDLNSWVGTLGGVGWPAMMLSIKQTLVVTAIDEHQDAIDSKLVSTQLWNILQPLYPPSTGSNICLGLFLCCGVNSQQRCIVILAPITY